MRASILWLAAAACSTTTSTTIKPDVADSSCREHLPDATHGLIGDAEVTLVFTDNAFTTTFTHAGVTYTSSGTSSYPAPFNLSLTLASSSGIDEQCLGMDVIYSFSWSDDCTFVGLVRDTEHCETRINNLEGVTLYTQK
jgi:hypothetical protein